MNSICCLQYIKDKSLKANHNKGTKDQFNMISMSNVSISSAVLEMLCELVSHQTAEKLEKVKERANQLVHERGRKLEDFLNVLV